MSLNVTEDLVHEHVTPIGTYIGIFVTLMVLTVITVYAATVDLHGVSEYANVVVALTVAVTKATLVVLYFMHLKHSSHLTWIVAGAGVLWLLILLLLLMGDYSSRNWMAAPPMVR